MWPHKCFKVNRIWLTAIFPISPVFRVITLGSYDPYIKEHQNSLSEKIKINAKFGDIMLHVGKEESLPTWAYFS